MRDLRKDLRQYIELRQALGYKLRKHEPRLTEFLAVSRSEERRSISLPSWPSPGQRSRRTAINTAASKG